MKVLALTHPISCYLNRMQTGRSSWKQANASCRVKFGYYVIWPTFFINKELARFTIQARQRHISSRQEFQGFSRNDATEQPKRQYIDAVSRESRYPRDGTITAY